MKEKDTFILDIKRLGINGEGIGFYNKCAIFVAGAIPGEGHNVEVTKVLGNMAMANSLEIKHVSSNRVEPKCPYYGSCGGCSVSHISYEEMLKQKREILIECLKRYTKINPRTFEIRSTVPSNNVYNYRNRSQLNVCKVDEHLQVAMIKANSNQLVPIKECLVQNTLLNKLNNSILKLAEKLNISVYLPKFNRGILRYISIRVNENNEALVCLICAEKNPKIKELAQEIMKLDSVIGVYENFNFSTKERNFFGPESNLIAGKPYLIEQLGKIKYRIYPNTFFQLNTEQAKNMYDLVLKACKLSFKEVVLDAYCGIGAISLYLAKMAKEVVGIEYNKAAIEAAKENAILNKITNVSFYQGDAKELLPKMLADGKIFDVIVVDPPRTGLDKKFIDAILASNVKRIVYVSCNPATLAKDIDILSTKYQINHITPLDMFPQTPLVETICQLSLRDETKYIPKV